MEPRTSAYGERLWLGDRAGGWREAHGRLVHHRERLVQRGIGADQITQQWCIQNPEKCLLSEKETKETEMEKCDISVPPNGSTVNFISFNFISLLLLLNLMF